MPPKKKGKGKGKGKGKKKGKKDGKQSFVTGLKSGETGTSMACDVGLCAVFNSLKYATISDSTPSLVYQTKY